MPTCPSCLQTKGVNKFYTQVSECKACFQLREGCKICSKCSTAKKLKDFYGDGKDYRCKICRRDYANERTRQKSDHINAVKRRWRKNNADKIKRETTDRRRKNPLAYKARTAVANALAAGKLFRKPCIMCGAEKVEAHHGDYSKPLEVVWMCIRHHALFHKLTKQNKEG